MKLEYFKLNHNRQIIKRVEIDLDNFIAVLATGHNWKLMRPKGRPLELYSMKAFDIYDEAVKLNYFEGQELFQSAKEKRILFYDDDPWREILKKRKTMTEQEKENQFFDERGGMIVGEDTPLWMWVAIPLVYLFYPFFLLYRKIKK